jgi:hypothetical protein
MKRREMVRTLAGAGALAALGAGGVLAGNIDPDRRLYGTPQSLTLRRRPRRDRLLTLVLARSEVPTGVWEESGALALLAEAALREPERARMLADDPQRALRELGYEPTALRLDAPEIRACLLLADEQVREAIDAGDAPRFVRLLRERGIEPAPPEAMLPRALQQALAEDTALGLITTSDGPLAGSDMTAYSLVVYVTALVFIIAAVVAVVAVVAVAYTSVSVSGSGGDGTERRRGSSSLGSTTLALQSGNPELVRGVRRQLIEERMSSLTEAAVEAARAHGIALGRREAERQVRAAIERVMRD